MAQNIGFLNFGIDGDDKAIKAKIDALKKDAASLEQIFKNIKIDSGGNLSKDTQKAQLSADKLAISNAKVAQSISDMERASVRLSNEKARSAEIDSRTAVNSLRQATEKQRQDEVALNMEIRKQQVNNVTAESMARKAAIEQKMQEQSLMNEARLEGNISDMERASVRLSNEKARSAEIDSRTAVNSLRQATEKQRQDEVALNMEIRKQRVSNVTAESMARKAAIEQKMQEQSLMNEARLEGIRKRNEEIGKRGQENFRKAVEGANKSLHTQNNILTNLEKKLIGVFSTYQIARFAKEVVNVRGEFQGLELAFTTMLGSAEKSQRMMIDVTELALKTPYTVTEVASNTKQLIAMGVEADNVMQTMKALGDVSAGVSVPMWRVAINYGQVSALGRLQAREIRDFAMAGIPIVDELAKVLGKTSAEITSMVSAGKIGFPEVEKAFQSMAGEGGKFHNMMEKQNSTVKGQMNRLQDQVELMMNSIGKSNEGIIYSTIGMASSLVENYEKVGRSIVSLIATYGVYRTAVAMASLSSRGYTLAEMARLGVMTAVDKVQKALNATMLANPYVLVATLAIGAVTAMWALHDSTSSAEKAQDRFNKKLEKEKEIAQEHKSKIDSLIDSSRDIALTDLQRGESLAELRKEYPKIFAQYDIESIKLADILDLKRQINAEDKLRADHKSKQDFESIEKEIEYYKNLAKAAGNGGAGYLKKAKDLEADRDILLKEKGKEISEQFIASLKDIDAADFDKYIKVLENKISGKGKDAKIKMKLPIDIEGTLSDEAIYDTNDLKNYIQILKDKKQNRVDEESNKTYNRQDLEEAKKNWEEAEKIRKNIVEHNDKFTSKQRKEAEEEVKRTREIYESLGGGEVKNTKQEKKDVVDIEGDIEKAQLDVRKQSTDDKLELLKIEEEQELKSLEKKYKEAAVSEEKKNELINLINEKYSVQRADIVKSELEREQELWNKYLTEYGTFQQQKLAVTNEYEHKISKAKSDVERKNLEKERDNKLSKIEVSAIKSEIDWVTVFGKFGGMFKDIIADTLAKTKEYTKTDEFKNADHASQKSVIEAINQMEKAVGGSSLSKNFKDLGKSVQNYHEAEKTLLILRDKEKVAMDNATKALNDYHKALKEGTSQEQEITKEAHKKAEKESENASNAVKSQRKVTQESQDGISESASKLDESMKNITSGLSKMSSRKLASIYEGFIESGKEMGGAIGGISKELKELPIIGWIASIIDIFKDGLSFVVGGILDSVFGAVSGILDDVLSGDLFVTIGESINKGVKDIFDAVSFGGTSKLIDLINGGNAKEVQRTTNRLTASNKVLKQSIDALKDEMARAKGLETVEVSKELKSKEKELRDNTSKLLATQMGYVGSHHSNNYYLRKAMNSSDWDKISKKVGKNVSSTSDLWALSPEDLKKVSTLTEVWDKIYNSGKYDKSKYLDDYLKLAGGLEEITKNLQETLTQTTFDGVYNEFIDMLMDMDVSAENFAENFSEYMMKAMLSNKVGTMFSDRLENWYNDFALKIKDGELSSSDIEKLKKTYGDIANEALELRDNLAKASGYDQKGTSKSTLSKGIQSITENTGDLLASYVNAMRADVAVTKEQLLKIVQMAQYSQTSLGGMLAQLLLIQTNTFNTANNTQKANEIAEKTFELLRSATTDGGITQFNIR